MPHAVTMSEIRRHRKKSTVDLLNKQFKPIELSKSTKAKNKKSHGDDERKRVGAERSRVSSRVR